MRGNVSPAAAEGRAVSIIMAAHNMAEWIGASVDSVRAQTTPHWELIVVDDGSTDSTPDLARSYGAKDSRIRVIQQSRAGVSTARNRGLEAAAYPLLLFLDADDLLLPNYLERMSDHLSAHPQDGAVLCGWKRVRGGHDLFGEEYAPYSENMFDVLALRPAFVIHACLIRREIVIAAGMFAPEIPVFEDWDLWQRVARLGVRFGRVREVLALYTMRPKSASAKLDQMLSYGLSALSRGHASDDRVSAPAAIHANGTPSERLFPAQVHMVCWCAGAQIAAGRDASDLPDVLPKGHTLSPCSQSIATAMLDGFISARPLESEELPLLAQQCWPDVESFLAVLADRAGLAGLTRSVGIELALAFLRRSPASASVRLGFVQSCVVEIARPLTRLSVFSEVDRLCCYVTYEGTCIGTVMVPVIEGAVPVYVLKDVIAAQLGWEILGEFFRTTLYSRVPAFRHVATTELHNASGWTHFLQELWGEASLSEDVFYNMRHEFLPDAADIEETRVRFEIGRLSDAAGCAPDGWVDVTLAGVSVGLMPPLADSREMARWDWVAAVTTWSALELCRVAVRELIVGHPKKAGTLRARLERICRPHFWSRFQQGAMAKQKPLAAIHGSSIIARWENQTLVASACRRYLIPCEAHDPVMNAARRNGNAVRDANGQGVVTTAPELIERVRPSRVIRSQTREAKLPSTRAHFEGLFAQSEDPWGYTSDYERVKYDQTLTLISGVPVERALELACAEGQFTHRLANVVRSVLATDVSEIAVDRTRKRCSGTPNVAVERLDMVCDDIPPGQDLIVCSEVLYYLERRDVLEVVAAKIVGALRPGGYFVTAHAHLVADEPEEAGFDWDLSFGVRTIAEIFGSIPDLQLIREIRTRLYRVLLFQKNAPAPKPVEIMHAETGTLPDSVARRVLWSGGTPKRNHRTSDSARLPILLYHSVVTQRESPSAFCLSAYAFERQISYLAESGYSSTTVQEWANCMTYRRVLPGHSVILTFDDAYETFYDTAWPILRRYGFSAVVAVPTAFVGGAGSWIGADGSRVMNWEQIRELASEGAQIASHSHTHPSLLACSLGQAACEAAYSKVILEEAIGHKIDTFCYPYGESDASVAHIVGGCGFLYALGTRYASSRHTDDVLMLPRLEVSGLATFERFVAQLAD